jgi:hypothetical protein
MNRTEQVESGLRAHLVDKQTPIKNMDNKVKDRGNQVNLSPYHKTAGDSTNEYEHNSNAESRVRLRLNEEPLQESGPTTYMGNILFSRNAVRLADPLYFYPG